MNDNTPKPSIWGDERSIEEVLTTIDEADLRKNIIELLVGHEPDDSRDGPNCMKCNCVWPCPPFAILFTVLGRSQEWMTPQGLTEGLIAPAS